MNTVKAILEHARLKHYRVIITTNGLQMHAYFPLIEQYHKTISGIHTNVDGPQHVHDRRRKSSDGRNESGFVRVVQNINDVRKLNIPITIAMNLDKNNIHSLKEYFDYADLQGWLDNDMITVELGRVDDRFYSGSYLHCFSEAELLSALIDFNDQHGLPRNIKLAFLKSTEFIARIFGLHFNQQEKGRHSYHYCWAATPLDDVYYIDDRLDIYRCTYSVGNKGFAVGNVSSGCASVAFSNHGFFKNTKCMSCSIGKYCAGGCFLSAAVDWERHCKEERANFDIFMKTVVVPQICSKLNKVLGKPAHSGYAWDWHVI